MSKKIKKSKKETVNQLNLIIQKCQQTLKLQENIVREVKSAIEDIERSRNPNGLTDWENNSSKETKELNIFNEPSPNCFFSRMIFLNELILGVYDD